MKRVIIITINASLLMLVFVFGITLISSDASAKKSSGEDVVILVCAANFSLTPPSFNVLASNSSSNSPSIATGTACAIALENLFVQDFEIKDVQPAFSGSGVLYTLIR